MRKQTEKKPRVDQKKARQRFRMLNVYFLSHFKYDLNEVLMRSELEETRHDQFKANLITKATRNGISDARDYVNNMIDEGMLDETSGERIRKLLQRYSKLR